MLTLCYSQRVITPTEIAFYIALGFALGLSVFVSGWLYSFITKAMHETGMTD